jgi:hypothetical protein
VPNNKTKSSYFYFDFQWVTTVIYGNESYPRITTSQTTDSAAIQTMRTLNFFYEQNWRRSESFTGSFSQKKKKENERNDNLKKRKKKNKKKTTIGNLLLVNCSEFSFKRSSQRDRTFWDVMKHTTGPNDGRTCTGANTEVRVLFSQLPISFLFPVSLLLVPLGTGTLLCTRAGKGRLTDVGNPA